MSKIQSTFTNMVLVLTLITVIAAGVLAGVYLLTEKPIADAKLQKQQAAEAKVLDGQKGIAIVVEENGFGGKMKVMVGFAPDGTILGYEVLEHQETPGLGDKSTYWFQKGQKPGQCIVGRQATGHFTVSKDGGDVDAITAATISSRAFLRAVNAAYREFVGLQEIEQQFIEVCQDWVPADACTVNNEIEEKEADNE